MHGETLYLEYFDEIWRFSHLGIELKGLEPSNGFSDKGKVMHSDS